METTVTAIFVDPQQAMNAQRRLADAGFPKDALALVGADTPHSHEFVGQETADIARGIFYGAAVGGVGAAIAGWALSLPSVGVLPIHSGVVVLIAAILGSIAGAFIGVLVGSATGHQVQQEYETLLAQGGMLLAVNTNRSHAPVARELLAKCGGKSISTCVHQKSHRGLHQTA
jgi:hypothetical protein